MRQIHPEPWLVWFELVKKQQYTLAILSFGCGESLFLQK